MDRPGGHRSAGGGGVQASRRGQMDLSSDRPATSMSYWPAHAAPWGFQLLALDLKISARLPRQQLCRAEMAAMMGKKLFHPSMSYRCSTSFCFCHSPDAGSVSKPTCLLLGEKRFPNNGWGPDAPAGFPVPQAHLHTRIFCWAQAGWYWAWREGWHPLISVSVTAAGSEEMVRFVPSHPGSLQ